MNRPYPLHSAVYVLLTGGRSHPLVHPQAEQLGYRMLNQFACSASRQIIYRRTTQWCRHTTHSPTSTFVVPSGAAAGVSVLLTSVFDRLSSVKLYVAEPEETVTHAEPSEYGISAKINTDPLTLQLCADPTINRLQEQMWFYAHGDWHFSENCKYIYRTRCECLAPVCRTLHPSSFRIRREIEQPHLRSGLCLNVARGDSLHSIRQRWWPVAGGIFHLR